MTNEKQKDTIQVSKARELKEYLEKIAAKDDRTLAYVARKAIKEYILKRIPGATLSEN